MTRLLAVLLLGFPASAGASSVDAADVAGMRGGGTIARFSYANDFFVGSDEYFTQGIGLLVFDPARGRGLVVRHDGFTPTSLRHDEALVGDRPFAATLTAGGIDVRRRDRWTLTSEVDAGVIGPAAGGEWMQTTIHRATGNHLPHGWGNQIANDVVLDASARIAATLLGGAHADVSPYADLALGTLYTDVDVGAIARVGVWRVVASAAAEEKLVGYDATLEGGLIDRSSRYVISPAHVERCVPRVEGGLTVDLGRVTLEGRRVWIGREFDGGGSHGWAELAVRAAF